MVRLNFAHRASLGPSALWFTAPNVPLVVHARVPGVVQTLFTAAIRIPSPCPQRARDLARKRLAEKLDQPCVEHAQILRLAHAVALIGEHQRLVGHMRAPERFLDHAHILRRHVGIVGALHDEEAALDAVDIVDGRALAIALGRHGRAAAHHLLAVGADVRPGRLVVDHEVGDAAPRGIAAIGGAGDADAAGPGDAARDHRLDAGADVVLLEPAPSGLADRLAEGDAEAGAAAVVGIEHAEARGDGALDE